MKRAAALRRREARSQTGLFLLEGPQAVIEALRCAPQLIESVFVSRRDSGRMADLLEMLSQIPVEVIAVTDQVLHHIADTRTPQGVVAVSRRNDVPLDHLFAPHGGQRPQLVAVLDGVSDPGNAGTVLRAADAAGADGVVFTKGSVDVFNPKSVRATTGSLFHIPFSVEADVDDVLADARAAGLTVIAADVSGEDLVTARSRGALEVPVAWVFGNEAHGLDDRRLSAMDQNLRLPIFGRAESLNLAMAATVCLYETAFAQRASRERRADER